MCSQAVGDSGGLILDQLHKVCLRITRITRAMADRRVLFFGDSLVAGVGDPVGLGWVGRVVAASFGAGLPVTGYNLSVRGETSVQIGSRWRQETRARFGPGADTRVVLSFGTNDATIAGGQRRVGEDGSCGAVRVILERAAMIGVPAFVVGPAPVDDPEQNRRIQALSVAFGNVCAARGTPFVSVVESLLASHVWRGQVAHGDGAHPAAEGYEALAQLVLASGWTDWLARETMDSHARQLRQVGARIGQARRQPA